MMPQLPVAQRHANITYQRNDFELEVYPPGGLMCCGVMMLFNTALILWAHWLNGKTYPAKVPCL
jgi:hypothetical protein